PSSRLLPPPSLPHPPPGSGVLRLRGAAPGGGGPDPERESGPPRRAVSLEEAPLKDRMGAQVGTICESVTVSLGFRPEPPLLPSWASEIPSPSPSLSIVSLQGNRVVNRKAWVSLLSALLCLEPAGQVTVVSPRSPCPPTGQNQL
uniref:Uncharacterized protein n=1 Tax=Chelonoidis abingdonii TaxID=106734 RepID=A0A8C0G366_CHEAB